MSGLSRALTAVRSLFFRERMEGDMDAELRHHMECFIEEQIRLGMPRAQAERLARIEFGSMDAAKEECREARGLRFFDELRQDLKLSVRILRKNPGFAITASVRSEER